jgi:hypothetical protein
MILLWCIGGSGGKRRRDLIIGQTFLALGASMDLYIISSLSIIKRE